MEYPFLKINLQALAGQQAPVLQWIREQNPGNKVPQNIRASRWGMLDWEYRPGQGLFQNLAPQKAYASWVVDRRPQDASLVVGGNLGYGLHFLLEKTAATHRILLLEPRVEMLLATLGLTDFSPALKQGRLLLVPPRQNHLRDMVYRLSLACLFGKVVLSADLPSRQLGPEYALWTHYAREALEDMRVELYTLRMRQEQIMRNELENLERARQEPNLIGFRGRAAGLKAVMLGAGPSLESFAPLLREHADRALYLTSLQTLPALQAYDLKPHLCLALECDPCLEKVYQNLDRDWVRDIPLIYAVGAAPGAVRAYPGPTIPWWTAGGLAAGFLADRDLLLDPGGHVALAMLRFLNWCGADQVLLVGHDFSWSGPRTHARNHPAAGREFRFDPQRDTMLRNRSGKPVYSNPVYLAALRDLENEIEHSEMPVYNLYGGGAVIRGSRSVTREEVLNQGHLESPGKNPSCFLREGFAHAGAPIRFMRFAGDRKPLAYLEELKKKLKKMFDRGKTPGKTLKTVLNRTLVFLEQDPFLKPYLFNEMVDLAGVLQTGAFFSRAEHQKIMKLITNMLEKAHDLERKCFFDPEKQGIKKT